VLLGLALLGAFDLEEVWSDSVAPAIRAHVTAPVAVGSLTVFLVLTAYVFVSAAIFLLGVEVDEALRKSSRKS
jgi:hypothetical protein